MLRDYQQNAVDAVGAFLKYRSGHGYVVAPGGSGKSHMIAAVGERVYDGGGRVLVLTRSEKLLTQNRGKFAPAYKENIGTYCAAFGLRQLTRPITIATAQSFSGQTLPNISVIVVDECDEISDDEESQYQTIFKAHPDARVIGFTATAFRTGSGSITWGEEIVNIPLKPLMDAGHLTPPTNKVGTTLDLDTIEVRIGEYVQAQLDEVYKNPALLALSVRKIAEYSKDRRSVLIFCQSITHADIVANALEHNDMPCVVVTGDTDKDELTYILQDFEEGRIKYLVNVALLVRGYDMPSVDMIAVLMATKSKRKWEQILYRGTRLHPNKRDFLVLDMGNNFLTHGPLGSPWTGGAGREGRSSPGKICPTCEDFTPPASASCPCCGYIFPEAELRQVSHASRPDSRSPTVYDPAGDHVVRYEVENVLYKIHKSAAKGTHSLRVDYYCSYGKYGNISQWIAPWSTSDWAQNKAWEFFKERGVDLAPPISGYSHDDLLWHADRLEKPTHITVDHGKEFPEIIRFEWDREAEPVAKLDDEIVW